MDQVVFEMDGLTVERRGSQWGRDIRFVVVGPLGQTVQSYATLADAKKWFFGIGL